MSRRVAYAGVSALLVLAVAAPGASAVPFTTTVGRLSGAVKALQKAVGNVEDINAGQTAAIGRVDDRVDTVVANLQALADKVDAIVATATAALAQVQAALSNPTTGLVGLNNARPQYGAFLASGAIVAGTGQTAGAKGPATNATKGSGGSAGVFVVDFGNDVSKRFLAVTSFPGAGSSGFPQAVVCSLTTGVACQNIQGLGSPDQSPNHVLVQFGTGAQGVGATPPTNGFAVAAFSG